ncbi:hypothetical protein K1719_031801 [Acacia pycnantha]|nr:hypothetical protein K1719_031801 [Acacia pycnantha]
MKKEKVGRARSTGGKVREASVAEPKNTEYFLYDKRFNRAAVWGLLFGPKSLSSVLLRSKLLLRLNAPKT